ncbi:MULTISPECIES: MarR family winged helix-turn-helix transcriptional regulator [unclassified Bacillus (in: firmicutes)]|uniref:MarR family winged helix-turn-helix transcriptional regulator n=1 Tax=unclassified Bacillus (in: firmicutes) TaxID=185979 RepID=UPI000BEFEC44|nr:MULTISPECIES: MarR family transcriptional regulator [unclassified Bacillus (in: firmicutes)]PEJ58318.1 MarR family transcriptional regulator [Bacillus sp. AFS002410]PEL08168.1 MarR family transcriptional regulator [Bacillus sp. AFS017336]
MLNSHNESSTSKSKNLAVLLWFRLARFYLKNVRESNTQLKKWGLTTAQFDVIVHVGRNKRLTQQELADKLVVTKGNVTHLLKKMEELQWIKREVEWKNKYLSLTDLGQKMYEEIVPTQEEFQQVQFSKLTEEEQLQLLNLLRKLNK